MLSSSDDLPTSTSLFRSSEALEVYLLGLVDFDAMQILQRVILDSLSQRDDRQGVLILCEHPPVVSIGRNGSIAGLLAEPEELTAQQIDVRYVARSGGVVVHGPGQVCGYLLLPLERLGISQRAFERRLESVLQKTAAERGVPAHRSESGAALECRCGQFAWIGSGVDSDISSHGFSLNVNPDVVTQRQIQAVADNTSIASLSMQKMRVVAMSKVREALVRQLSAEFGYEDFHIYTRHPQLKRASRKLAAPLQSEEVSPV